ncbi:hypothetical protein IE81DRAFT_331631 [Ceraceosorus guamensis]|uniref:TTI1 C-terminal TPR domain-containing protein n=1 Tax=Ceraceosorus guamensis TaxID=1522189 RepID=A0A316VVX5_9BASI|nr:hypothetical protein IE81DRAFT_331631 [Ceraceosorus guamensis]PWN40451.1 hypothetical protein IE81DRAFT_331631 [Ceraceosorus guamensis]
MSLFAPPFATQPSASDADVNAARFKELKPVCVELLSNCPSSASGKVQPGSHPRIRQLLHRLDSLLQSYTTHAQPQPISEALDSHPIASTSHLRIISHPPFRHPLSLSLINYIFYPLAQLFKSDADGKSGALPDAVRQQLFRCLALLAHDWWSAFAPAQVADGSGKANESWKVWHQLLILGVVALVGSPAVPQQGTNQASQETQTAIIDFLLELLAPRIEVWHGSQTSSSQPDQESEWEWEWDGVSELPLQDEGAVDDGHNGGGSRARASSHVHSSTSLLASQSDLGCQRYPCEAHVDHAITQGSSKGALAHALSGALDIASGASGTRQLTTSTRTRAVSLARVIFVVWLTGVRLDKRGRLQHLSRDAAPGTGVGIARLAQRATTFLPGFVSSMTRTAVGQVHHTSQNASTALGDITKTPGALVAAALDALKDALLITMADHLGLTTEFSPLPDHEGDAEDGARFTDLASMVEAAQLDERSLDVPFDVTKERSGTVGPGQVPASIQTTLERVGAALAAMTGVVKHQHASAQLAAVQMASELLTHAGNTLDLSTHVATISTDHSSTSRMLFVWLLDINASRLSATIVVEAARNALSTLTTEEQVSSSRLAKWAELELAESLRRLPRAIVTHDDENTTLLAGRLAALVRCLSGDHHLGPQLATLFTSTSVMERLTSQLLPALVLGSVDEAAERASYIRLRHVDKLTTHALLDMLIDVGKGLAQVSRHSGSVATKQKTKDSFQLVVHFLTLGQARRTSLGVASDGASHDRRLSASALLLASQLMSGIAQALGDETTRAATGRDGKRARKAAHRLARDAANAVIDMWEADQDQLLIADQYHDGDTGHQYGGVDGSADQLSTTAISGVEVEHRKGLPHGHQMPTELEKSGAVLDLSFVESAHIAKIQSAPSRHAALVAAMDDAAMQLQCGDVLLFSIVGSCSDLLGISFRPLLLHTLYPLICGLASSSGAVAQAASTTLQRVAKACAYPDMQSLVLQHADYILGAASHRLVAGLGPELQAVTAVTERMQSEIAGEDAKKFHLTRELVRAHHGNKVLLPAHQTLTPLNSAQTAPLVLIEVLRLLGSDALPLVEDAVDEVLDALDRFHGYDELCNGLLGLLDRMLEVMAIEKANTSTKQRAPSNLNTLPSFESELASFEGWYRGRKSSDNHNNVEPPLVFEPGAGMEHSAEAKRMGPDDNPDAPSRTQAVTSNILAKCVPFLSHSSPLLRVTVLRLLRRGVSILAPQERHAEILAVINPAWPVLLTRLGSPVTLQTPARRNASGEQLLDRFTERDPTVWVESAKLMEEVATHLPDFLGRKIVEEVWPRLDALLEVAATLQTLESRRSAQRGPVSFSLASPLGAHASSSPHAPRLQTLPALSTKSVQLFPEFSTVGRLLQSVASTMAALAKHMNVRMTDATAWTILNQPQLLCALDRRQPKAISESARKLLEAMKLRDADLVWAVWWESQANGHLEVATIFQDVMSRSAAEA